MIQVSLYSLLGILFIVGAVFLVLKKFSLPASFYENQTKREEMLRSKIRREDQEPAGNEDEETEKT